MTPCLRLHRAGIRIDEAADDRAPAAGIRVIAVSVPTGGYADGLDGDPSLYGGDYAWFYGIAENGAAGQASRIAAPPAACTCSLPPQTMSLRQSLTVSPTCPSTSGRPSRPTRRSA